jgi:hypothetical protein
MAPEPLPILPELPELPDASAPAPAGLSLPMA